MRARLRVALIFVAVGLGALSVALLHDPMALIPYPPYWRWIFVRTLQLASLALLGTLLLFGVLDDPFDVPDDSRERPIHWRAVGIAYLISALATATFIAVSALVDYLEGIAA